jgi:hypothetical protein
MPCFKDVVSNAWGEPVPHSEPCQVLFAKLHKTGFKLSQWSKSLFSNAKLQLAMALEVVYRFYLAMEHRELSVNEKDIRTKLKRRIIALAALERTRKRQCS